MRSSLKSLLERIGKFAATQVPGGDGYAPVSDADVRELAEIVDALIRCRWQDDADGDRPVDFRIIDRTKYERMFFEPIPYVREATKPADYDEAIECAVFNVAAASRKLDQLFSLRRARR